MKQMEKVLVELAGLLNDKSVNWGIGASYLLYLNGLVDQCGDLDFVIDPDDALKVSELLLSMNVHVKEIPRGEKYKTKKLLRFDYKNVEVDFLVGFMVNDFIYPTGEHLTSEYVVIEDEKIYLCSLSDWLTAYKEIDRPQKVEIIKEFLNAN